MSGGVALGMFEGSTYEAGELQLNPGDALLMYSDGLTEAESPEGQPFDEAGLESSIATSNRNAFADLISENANPGSVMELFESMAPDGQARVVLKERDRTHLEGSLPGEGFRLVIDLFIDRGPRGRIATWNVDIRRPRGDDLGPQPWRIVSEDRLASIDGLHRLSLRPDRQFAARNLVIRAIDFELRLPSGDVFVSDTPDGTTAMVLIGDGSMVFQPLPKQEKASCGCSQAPMRWTRRLRRRSCALIRSSSTNVSATACWQRCRSTPGRSGAPRRC